jgi:hypothetical protein
VEGGQVAADPDVPSYRTIYDWLSAIRPSPPPGRSLVQAAPDRGTGTGGAGLGSHPRPGRGPPAAARDERLADEVLMLSERAGPANLHLAQPRVKRLQQRVAAVRPALWRWD